MSALGHKRTFAVHTRMSALPPIADICSAQAHVRFVPIADIDHCGASKRKRPPFGLHLWAELLSYRLRPIAFSPQITQRTKYT